MGRGFAGARPARLPRLRFGKGALLEMGFPLFWEYHSFVGNAPASRLLEMHPPLLFLRARRKRRAPCSVEKKKRAFGCRLGGSRLSPLAAQVIRTLYRWRPVVTLAVLLAALRAGAKFGRCAVRSLCFCCASIAWVYRGCTAANLLRCASPSAVAAQCALWVRSWKIFCFVEWKKHFSFFSAHNTLAAPQRTARRQQKETRYISAFSPLPFCKTTPLTNGVKRALYRTPPSYCISALRSNSEKRRRVKQICRRPSLVHPSK